jgi:hypothetical protein
MALFWTHLRKMGHTEHAKIRELKRGATGMVNLSKMSITF